MCVFFFQAEDGIRDLIVTGVQTCALPIFGATFRFLGRTDEERRALLESVEPVWEGNQVWFILAGGVVFAAWPLLYAASFSGLYLAMLVLLLALILRPVGFTFRDKIAATLW